MRAFKSKFLLLVALVAASSGIYAFGTESGLETDGFAIRSSADFYVFPVSSGDLTLEGALGLCDVSLSAWVGLQALPMSISGFGGELSLTKEWLSLSLSTSQVEGECALRMIGRADPPAWLLIDGNFSLLLGTKALAGTNLSGGLPGSEIALSPALTGVASVAGIVVKPSIGLDLSLGNQTPYPAISGSRVSATADAGVVTASSTVFFIGNFETLSSVVVSICLPDCGLSVSASLVPTEIGGVRYRAGISYEWGNTSLLPILTGEPGTICTDEVCF